MTESKPQSKNPRKYRLEKFAKVALSVICFAFLSSANLCYSADNTSTLKSVAITDAKGVNKPPTAVIKYTNSGAVYTFDASQSSDSDGSIVSYKWDFGDAITKEGVNVNLTLTSSEVPPISLTVIDDKGGVSISQERLSVPQINVNELQQYSNPPSKRSDVIITLNKGIEPGHRLVIINSGNTNNLITSAMDSRGNTYRIDKTAITDGRYISIVSSLLASRLVTGDVITLKHASTYIYEYGQLFDISGSLNGVATSANNSGYGTSVNIPGTITNVPIVAIGVLKTRTQNFKPDNFSLTSNSPFLDYFSQKNYYFYKVISTAGVVNSSGLLSSITNWGGVWVGYY